MAGLDDINSSNPAGNETPTLGDNRIRALAAKVIEAFEVEHSLAGPHTILIGSAAQRPAAGYKGRFYILTAAGVEPEIQYDTGAAWVTITSNQTSGDIVVDLAAHIAATPIDHPNESVTQIKIAPGAILKKHLDGSGDSTTLENLVNGGNADSHHVHGAGSAGAGKIAEFTSNDTWTCPDGIILVEIEAWGAGGGGGGASTHHEDAGGGGGGGGGYVKQFCTVIPGTDYAISIGLAGAGGTHSSDGISGGNTSFGGTVFAYGGGKGLVQQGATGGAGGAGGSFTGSSDLYGGGGCDGVNGALGLNQGGRGGGNPCGLAGTGGAGGDGSNPGEPVNGSLAGGGGGGGREMWSDGHGANGAKGYLILRW